MTEKYRSWINDVSVFIVTVALIVLRCLYRMNVYT